VNLFTNSTPPRPCQCYMQGRAELAQRVRKRVEKERTKMAGAVARERNKVVDAVLRILEEEVCAA